MFVLIAAVIGIISMFLPWIRISVFGFSRTVNGMHGVGILVFLCLVIAGIAAYLGDQTKSLDNTMWMIVLVCGGLGTMIMLWNIIHASTTIFKSYLRFGIFLTALSSLGVLLAAFFFRSSNITTNSFQNSGNDVITN
jgi:hypothetical protein